MSIYMELHDVMLKDLQSLKLKVIDHFNLLSILFNLYSIFKIKSCY